MQSNTRWEHNKKADTTAFTGYQTSIRCRYTAKLRFDRAAMTIKLKKITQPSSVYFLTVKSICIMACVCGFVLNTWSNFEQLLGEKATIVTDKTESNQVRNPTIHNICCLFKQLLFYLYLFMFLLYILLCYCYTYVLFNFSI